jgi:hypothetical protein
MISPRGMTLRRLSIHHGRHASMIGYTYPCCDADPGHAAGLLECYQPRCGWYGNCAILLLVELGMPL